MARAVHLGGSGRAGARVHRIVVMRDRRKVGELPGGCSEDQVYELIAAPASADARLTGLLEHRLFWPLASRCCCCSRSTRLFNPGFLAHRMARRPSLRQPHRHPQPRRAAGAGVAGHDAGDRRARPRHLGGRGGGDCRGGGGLDDRRRSHGDADASPLSLPSRAALGVALLCGLWNGLLVVGVGMQPIIATLILMVAGRGIAQLITDGQILTIYYAPYCFPRQRLPARPAVLAVRGGGGVRAAAPGCSRARALGLFIQAIGINPVAARVAGVRARPIIRRCMRSAGSCAGLAGLLDQLQREERRRQQRRPAAGARRHPRRDAGRHRAHRRAFSLAGSVIGALIIQTLTYDHLLARRAAAR